MRTLILPVAAAVMLFCSGGCKKVNEATEFDINYSTNLTVPSSSITVTAPVDFTSPEVSTDTGNRFASEKTTKDLIDEITLSKFEITNTSGNLDFLKSISVYIKASGLPDVLVATKSNIPAGQTKVTADVTGANIKEHLFKDKIQFRATVTISTGLKSDQVLKIDQTVHISGKKIK